MGFVCKLRFYFIQNQISLFSLALLSHPHALSLFLLPIYSTLSIFPRIPLAAKEKKEYSLKETWKLGNMAMELELDDDVFFADISKQISLLIMDEDEHLNPVNLSSSTSLSFQDLSRGGYQTAPYMHHQEQSKGTGVFIPRASQPRRRQQHHHQKQGRFSSFNAKQHHSLYHSRQEYQQNHEHSRSTLTTHNNKKLSMNSTVPLRAYRDPTSIYT